MAKRKCYGYAINSDGELEINPDEATVVSWIFERYLAGNSLGKIATDLERQGIPSPTGRPRWNREAIDKLLSNEKYTGRVIAPEDNQHWRCPDRKQWPHGTVSLHQFP